MPCGLICISLANSKHCEWRAENRKQHTISRNVFLNMHLSCTYKGWVRSRNIKVKRVYDVCTYFHLLIMMFIIKTANINESELQV